MGSLACSLHKSYFLLHITQEFISVATTSPMRMCISILNPGENPFQSHVLCLCVCAMKIRVHCDHSAKLYLNKCHLFVAIGKYCLLITVQTTISGVALWLYLYINSLYVGVIFMLQFSNAEIRACLSTLTFKLDNYGQLCTSRVSRLD